MARCIQFISNQTQEPISLNALDTKICNLIGVEESPSRYGGVGENAYPWFHVIGAQIAEGHALNSAGLREQVEKWHNYCPEARDNGVKILNFLEENFTSKSFWCR